MKPLEGMLNVESVLEMLILDLEHQIRQCDNIMFKDLRRIEVDRIEVKLIDAKRALQHVRGMR